VSFSSDLFQLRTDALGVGIGSVLNVIREGVEYLAAFYSCQLKGAGIATPLQS